MASTTRSFIELVRAVDPDFDYESRYPVEYRFGEGRGRSREFRGGPTRGAYGTNTETST